ncbi:unnamed protein product [Hymenolepis diminuta]|uniref:Integrase_H2C2 domain-containing protein n=1 Tax=Hymenolepis diminuta TaxID=6216 RepID=A0A0R3SZ93_HYMDI|nr:unnamed protein product [Hymenolepis diminuta]
MVVESCSMFSDKVIVPSALRYKVLRQFYSRHPRIRQMKSPARGYAFWPRMEKDIEYHLRQCDKCQQAAKNHIRQHPALWSQAEAPWGINNPNDLRHSDWSTVSKKSRFAVNTSVDARDYRLSRKWTAGIIVTRHGAMIYDVEVGWWRTRGFTTIVNSHEDWRNPPFISVIYLCVHYPIRSNLLVFFHLHLRL